MSLARTLLYLYGVYPVRIAWLWLYVYDVYPVRIAWLWFYVYGVYTVRNAWLGLPVAGGGVGSGNVPIGGKHVDRGREDARGQGAARRESGANSGVDTTTTKSGSLRHAT